MELQDLLDWLWENVVALCLTWLRNDMLQLYLAFYKRLDNQFHSIHEWCLPDIYQITYCCSFTWMEETVVALCHHNHVEMHPWYLAPVYRRRPWWNHLVSTTWVHLVYSHSKKHCRQLVQCYATGLKGSMGRNHWSGVCISDHVDMPSVCSTVFLVSKVFESLVLENLCNFQNSELSLTGHQ